MENQKTALMFHRQFLSTFQSYHSLFSVSYFEILRFLSVIEIYIKMSEILILWLSALISQMAPYLIFIYTPAKVYTFCQYGAFFTNARLCRNCVLIRPTTSYYAKWYFSNTFKVAPYSLVQFINYLYR